MLDREVQLLSVFIIIASSILAGVLMTFQRLEKLREEQLFGTEEAGDAEAEEEEAEEAEAEEAEAEEAEAEAEEDEEAEAEEEEEAVEAAETAETAEAAETADNDSTQEVINDDNQTISEIADTTVDDNNYNGDRVLNYAFKDAFKTYRSKMLVY
jgi:cytoskeletal protein RodZ